MAASAARLAVAAIEDSVPRCAHCGKQGVDLKRCSLCKQTSYCRAECQKAGWRRHKKTCALPLTLGEVHQKVSDARAADDWRGLLKWEGRMEELLDVLTDENDSCNSILAQFVWAHKMGRDSHEMGGDSTSHSDHAISLIRLEERRVDLLGKMELFRDQAAALVSIAANLFLISKIHDAAVYFQRARDLGAEHGFFSAECQACLGLGSMAFNEGRHEEGVALLRNAVAAAPLSESLASDYERNALHSLVDALFRTNAIDELEPLVARCRETAEAHAREEGLLVDDQLSCLIFSARLHAVLCIPSTSNPLQLFPDPCKDLEFLQMNFIFS